MHLACQEGHLEVAQWLFDHSASEDVRTADDHGWTPMHTACIYGHVEVAQWLFDVSTSEDMRKADRFGLTPIILAWKNGHLEVVLWIILNSAANNNNSTGSVDGAIIREAFTVSEFSSQGSDYEFDMEELLSDHVPKKQDLRSAMEDLLSDHSNFISIILPAVWRCTVWLLPAM